MNRLKSRVTKLERKIGNHEKRPVTIKVVYLGDANWRKIVAQEKQDYLARHGSLKGLQIVLTKIPPPAPPPSKEALDLVWTAGEPAAGSNGNADGGSNPAH